ncbi:4-hydroxy-tetrahydrodipicolinate reductase [Clostridium aestuarii]|uniref:4-hydroxy-tetrahydrodipicolinate reductase n=1 Tax=Clostridium aestuarii TaxID=338193 RepID=A0ABT4CUX9_9CLOT|nr:4-hydroxy-tetrahydrodipicolinate reductase [Clostridium aestuarii]MCY6482784.1 4-hydroxy-tetrahydrodipicolinate reductase [Clostridium aestuarii]
MVKILLSGCCGRMGKVISECISNFPNLTITAGIDKYVDSSLEYPVFKNIEECTLDIDVILDFSNPATLNSLTKYAKIKNTPLVLCTTGYSEQQLEDIKNASNEIPMFRSANMSIGINVINNILKKVSAMLYDNYDIELVEKHHNQKLDSPSGTALLLANTIKESIPHETVFNKGRDGIGKRPHNEIGIHAIRGGSIVGEHEVIFAGQSEIIELKHTALSREVFAVGALKACEFMYGKTEGMYSMDNVIND